MMKIPREMYHSKAPSKYLEFEGFVRLEGYNLREQVENRRVVRLRLHIIVPFTLTAKLNSNWRKEIVERQHTCALKPQQKMGNQRGNHFHCNPIVQADLSHKRKI